MVAAVGRKCILKKNSIALIGMRNVSISDGNESIDVTTGEDDGVRLLLSETGQQGLDISFDGIMKDAVLRDLSFTIGTDRLFTDIEIELPIVGTGNTTNATITGNFRLGAFSNEHPYNESVTFSSTLESSGPWVYTPESA